MEPVLTERDLVALRTVLDYVEKAISSETSSEAAHYLRYAIELGALEFHELNRREKIESAV